MKAATTTGAARAAFSLRLAGHPATLNQLMRGKLKTRMALAKRDLWWFAGALSHVAAPKATGKRRVTLGIVLGPRQRGADPDAFFKSTGDCLVRLGLLLSDDRFGVEWGPTQYVRGAAPETVVTLEDLP